jgi:steroid delta-isomerase-like uncharacterized protein
MSIERNKQLVRSSFEFLSRNDLESYEQLLDDHVVLHDQDDQHDIHGKVAAMEFVRRFVRAFPDMQIEVDEIVAEGDNVVTRWTAIGTHGGPLLGIEPTNRSVTVHGIEFDTVRDGRIVETWQNWDALGMFQQIGQMPSEAALAG